MFYRQIITAMQHIVNPHKIILAREARGFTQSELAQKLHTYKAAISPYRKWRCYS
jgi:ribosome-binding protein aMBF1 (putative translation factor)